MASTACFLHQISTLSSTAARTSSQRSYAPSLRSTQIVCQAQKQDDAAVVSRRLALTVLIGVAAIGSKVSPADAAYGESANIFGQPKTNTEYMPYNGDGFKLAIPSKWNPSKEREFPGQVDFLLGKQSYFGKTDAEGGFDSGAVATANILETSTTVIGGKQYYFLSVLTRTADGDEGGKHQLITASVSDGNLYICKAQAGDKRWFKRARKLVEGTANSFGLA